MTDVAVTLPIYTTPIIDMRGNISEVWWRFFTTLLTRTGGTEGVDISVIRDRLELLVRQFIALDALDAASVPDQSLSRDQSLPSVVAHHGQQQDPGLHALVTALADGFMRATDKIKLDALVAPISAPSELIADVVTQNTTADGAVLSMTLGAGTLIAGATLNLDLYGLVTSAAMAGTFVVWVKIGATKALSSTLVLTGLATVNAGLGYSAKLTVRAAGGAGNAQLSASLGSSGGALGVSPQIGSANAAIDTTIANTITLGWNWSVANVGNIATAKNASLSIEKQ